MCPPRPARIMTTVSAVSARSTVEMLNAPERAKVSTDVPSQAPNLSQLANDFADHRRRPRSSNTTKLRGSRFDGDPPHAATLYFSNCKNRTLSMDEEASNRFEVHRTPNGKFYITSGPATPICTGTGSMVYFEEERDALEFLVEMIDIVTDRALGRLFEDFRKHAAAKATSCRQTAADEIWTSTK